MKRLCLILCWLICGQSLSLAQSDPVATPVPPTPIAVIPQATAEIVPSQSTIARIQGDGLIRVGILYNEAPFSTMNIRGELVGFDADLARLLAEMWTVELQFVQVTRQNRFDMLRDGNVDLLIAAVEHQRQDDALFEFSQTYRLGAQVVMVKADSDSDTDNTPTIRTVFNLGGQAVGYVVGTKGQTALENWSLQTGIQVQARPYLTYDEMLGALFSGEVAAIVGRDTHLLRVANTVLDAVSILETALQQEAFGIVTRRQDRHMRNLVNRSLQYLASDGDIGVTSTLEKLALQYFPNDDFAFAALPIYEGIGDEAPRPAQFPTDIPLPQQDTLAQVINQRVVRVAGLPNPDDLPLSQAAVVRVNNALVNQIAARWGAQVQIVEGDPIAAIVNGQADLAVGITPSWDLAAQVDFSQPYAQHGRRLMYPSERDFDQLGDLQPTSRIIALIGSDEGAQELVEAWGPLVNIRNFSFFLTTPDDAADVILRDNNALVVFADSLLLMPIVQANPEALAIGPTWYDRQYLVFAVPQNDTDFRRLVNYTLQEMLGSGELATIINPITPDTEGEAAPEIGIWSGTADDLGIDL